MPRFVLLPSPHPLFPALSARHASHPHLHSALSFFLLTLSFARLIHRLGRHLHAGVRALSHANTARRSSCVLTPHDARAACRHRTTIMLRADTARPTMYLLSCHLGRHLRVGCAIDARRRAGLVSCRHCTTLFLHADTTQHSCCVPTPHAQLRTCFPVTLVDICTSDVRLMHAGVRAWSRADTARRSRCVLTLHAQLGHFASTWNSTCVFVLHTLCHHRMRDLLLVRWMCRFRMWCNHVNIARGSHGVPHAATAHPCVGLPRADGTLLVSCTACCMPHAATTHSTRCRSRTCLSRVICPDLAHRPDRANIGQHLCCLHIP